jgi:hypothetical protein
MNTGNASLSRPKGLVARSATAQIRIARTGTSAARFKSHRPMGLGHFEIAPVPAPVPIAPRHTRVRGDDLTPARERAEIESPGAAIAVDAPPIPPAPVRVMGRLPRELIAT